MRSEVDDIAALCVDRLGEPYTPATGLFDRQLRRGSWGPTGTGESLTSTAIVLIGLTRAGVPPERIGFDPARTRTALWALSVRWRDLGPLGLILWSNVVTGGPPLAEVLRRLGLSFDELEERTARFTTMEVAWLLSGLAHELGRAPEPATRKALERTGERLLGRYVARTRTFGHAAEEAGPLRRLRRWVANFADQIYPVQALALASIAGAGSRFLDCAAASAAHMASLQGPLGQWWWHYDARDGRIAQAYPVYSVHQHGMAPMALETLEHAGGPSFEAFIQRSRRWLVENELGRSLFDPSAGTIWRDIERAEGALPRGLRRVHSIFGGKDEALVKAAQLRINHETRPYEWAWYIYADAIGRGAAPTLHLV